MTEDTQNNHRDEMLARFRESIRHPISERFFDEDELLEIFDYAGDINDEYLRTEALLCAARFYPDSEAFLERKAVYYSQFSPDMRDRFLEDNPEASGMIWDILRVRRIAESNPEAALTELDKIVEKYSNFTDEETIQLIDLPSSMGNIEWIKQHMPVLRKKVGFINILLYEVAVAADSNNNPELSVSMLEELTELEPYNPYYWMMLAKEYAVIDEAEKALSAIDYSLAINPDDAQALQIKARLLYAINKQDAEVINLLEQAIKAENVTSDIVRFLAMVYSDAQNNEKAIETLRSYLAEHQFEATAIVPDLILFEPDDTDSLLDKFYSSNDDNSQVLWISWSHQLMLNGMHSLSRRVMQAYQRNSGIEVATLMPIEQYFIEGRFHEALQALGEYLENNETNDIDFSTMVVIHLVSMVKIGEMFKALAFCDFIEKSTSLKAQKGLSKRIEYYGMMSIVKKVRRLILNGDNMQFYKNFDPLKLWSNDPTNSNNLSQ